MNFRIFRQEGLVENEKGGGPGRPASFFPLTGNPASLTEGD
jgi:hypothetical protein